jgi:hypothetical protein
MKHIKVVSTVRLNHQVKSSFDLELGVALEVGKEEELVAKILDSFSAL